MSDNLFLMRAYEVSLSYVTAFFEEMCGEQGFKAVHKMVHWAKFIGKGCLIFLLECLCYAT